jgi:hypothetical protein
VARREQGRERAALQLPLLGLGGEQPVAEARRQDAALQVVLAVARGVVDQDVPDRGRIADHRHPPERAVAGDVRCSK